MRSKLFIFFLFSFLFLASACSDGVGKYDSFADCLYNEGVVMYGTEWCPHCQNQKAEFGKSFDHVNYVDCDKDRESCLRAGVKGYPTWVIDSQSYAGEQSLERLASLSGCELV